MDKEEQLQQFYEQYRSLIKIKNGFYIYPDTLPEILKEYLEKQNDIKKDFPNWTSNKPQEVEQISEEERKKDIEELINSPILTELD